MSEQLVTSAAILRTSAKETAHLAAKQAEVTTIQQIQLPNAYLKLGRLAYEQFNESERLSRCPEISSTLNQIRTLNEGPSVQSPNGTFTEKAKALGGKALTAAKLQAAELKLRKQMIALGKDTFENERYPNDANLKVDAIRQLLCQAAALQSEADDVKQKMAGQSVYSWLYSTAVVGASAVFCAPIGLFLIWLHPTWAKATKIRWASVSVGCFLLLAFMRPSPNSTTLPQTSGDSSANNTTTRLNNDGGEAAELSLLDDDPDFARIRKGQVFYPFYDVVSEDRALELMAVHVLAGLMSNRGKKARVGPEQVRTLMKAAAISFGCQQNEQMRYLMEIEPETSTFEVEGCEKVIDAYGSNVFFHYTAKPTWAPNIPWPLFVSVQIDGTTYSGGNR